jgi:putative membrane protein
VNGENDPRVYFAAERTLLAWLRTGLSVVGIGFLVARFGLLIRVMRASEIETTPPVVSTLIGVGFVLLGTLMIGVAGWQHARFCRRLPADQRPIMYSMWLSQAVAGVVSVLCAALAAYLLLSTSR